MTTPDSPETQTPSPAPTEAPAEATLAEPKVSESPNTPESSVEPPAQEPPGETRAEAKDGDAAQTNLDSKDSAAEEGKGEGKKRRRKKQKGPAGGEGEDAKGPREPREARDRGDRGEKGAPPRAAFRVGEEIFGRVKEVRPHALIIDIPGKGDAVFDSSEFDAESALPEVGERFVAKVLGDGGRGGLVVLTRKYFDDPAYEDQVKEEVEKAFNEKSVVLGLVTGAIKGGLEVYVKGLRTFAPASHVDLRPGADLSSHIGQQFLFLVEQFAKKGRDVVLSRKAFLEEEFKKQREGSLAKLSVDSVVSGVVRSVVDWGVFVSIPDADDIEGLIHVTEVSHDPRARLRDVVKIGDTIQVKIVKIDEKGKLWLSKKAAEPDPWEEIRRKYTVGSRHKGKIVKILPFGCFVSLEPGREGLIHTSDLSFKHIESPSEVVKEGQEIEVVIATIDSQTKKIGLHPAIPGTENETRQRVAPHKMIKVAVVSHEPQGLVVRILGATGRSARGFIPAGHTGTPRGTDLRKEFPAGSTHEVKVIEIDPRRGEAKLSIKALREDSEKADYNEYRRNLAKEAKFGTLADLLKKSQQS